MLFKFFWLICGLWVGLGGALYGKYKSPKLIAEGKITLNETTNILRGWFLCIFTPSILFWLLHLSVGDSHSIDFKTWPNPQKSLALTLMFACWATLVVWVFRFKGASKLSKVFILISNFPEAYLKPVYMKAFTIMVVISGVTALFMPSI